MGDPCPTCGRAPFVVAEPYSLKEVHRDAKHEKARADHARRGQSRCTRCEDRGETIRRLVAERDALARTLDAIGPGAKSYGEDA